MDLLIAAQNIVGIRQDLITFHNYREKGVWNLHHVSLSENTYLLGTSWIEGSATSDAERLQLQESLVHLV